MRSDEEQLRIMEKKEERGELTEASRRNLIQLRQEVNNRGGDVKQPVKEERPPPQAAPKGFNLHEKINNLIGNSPADKEFRRQKKETYQAEYRKAVIHNQRILARKNARKEISGKKGGGFGGNFISASLNELGGAFQGARAFNEGGYGGGGGSRHGKRKRRGGGGMDYMPAYDLSDFIM